MDALDRIERQSGKAVAKVESDFKRLGATIGAALGGALSAGALAASFKQTVDAMDALNDAADQTGSSVEELSSLLNTLSPYGATLDQITDATGKLARAMAGADDETKGAGAAFAALGIATRDASGNLRPTVDVLTDVAQALDQYEDGTNKTVLVQQLFGKAGAALLPMLKDLAGAEKATASVTKEQAAQAEALNVALGRLNVEFDRLRVQLAGPVLTALADLVSQFNEGREAAGGFWEAVFRYGLKYGPDKSPAERVAEIGAEIGRLNAQIAADEKKLGEQGPVYGARFVDRIDAARKKVAELQKDVQYFGRQAAREQGRDPTLRAAEDRGFIPSRGQAPGGGGGGRTGVTPRSAGAVEDYEARIARAAADAIGAADVVKAKEFADTLARLDALFFDAGLSAEVYDGAVRALTKSSTVAGDDGAVKLNRALDEQTERFLELIDPLRAYRKELEKVAEQERLYTESGGERGLSPFQAEIARGTLQARFDPAKVEDEVREVNDAARDLGLTFQSAFEDAIVGGEKFSKVLQSLGQDILRILVRKTITEPIIGGLLGDGKTGGLLSPLLAAIGIGERAAGGPVGAGLPYLVGERGPELIVPRSAGTVIPNHALGGVPTVVHNHYHIDSRTDRSVIVADIQRAQLASLGAQRDARARGNEAFA